MVDTSAAPDSSGDAPPPDRPGGPSLPATSSGGHGPGTGLAAGAPHREATWQQVAQTPEFQELVTRKRAWIVPATVFFLSWYLLFILMAGYAEDFMGSEFLVDGLTVGYVFALSQFVMTFVLAVAYVRRSRDVFDPLRVRALERAAEIANEPATTTAGRPAGADRTGGAR